VGEGNILNKFTYWLARTLIGVIRVIYPTKVFGTRTLEKKKSMLVGNHISGWDPIIVYAFIKPHINFLYKSEFEKSKFLHWALHGLDFIPVRRGEIDITATKNCLKTLNNGNILGLFPEGTRSPDVDRLGDVHSGAAMYAIKTKSPMRAFYIWDRAKPFRKNYLMMGEEFELSQYYDLPVTKQMLEEATQVVRDKMEELRIATCNLLKDKGVKRRKRSKSELARLNAFLERQQGEETGRNQ
jgi:1-acyl-sn-glycerol-3-phosphate acyltransferase